MQKAASDPARCLQPKSLGAQNVGSLANLSSCGACGDLYFFVQLSAHGGVANRLSGLPRLQRNLGQSVGGIKVFYQILQLSQLLEDYSQHPGAFALFSGDISAVHYRSVADQ